MIYKKLLAEIYIKIECLCFVDQDKIFIDKNILIHFIQVKECVLYLLIYMTYHLYHVSIHQNVILDEKMDKEVTQ